MKKSIVDQLEPLFYPKSVAFVGASCMRGVTGLIERIKKCQKPVILAAPPTSKEESEAIKEFEKNGIMVHSTPERAIRILVYITQYAEDRKRKSA